MSQENQAREAMQKYSRGEGVNDYELKMLLEFFKRIVRMLDETVEYFSPLYGFAQRDARHNLETLKCFDRARRDAKKEE